MHDSRMLIPPSLALRRPPPSPPSPPSILFTYYTFAVALVLSPLVITVARFRYSLYVHYPHPVRCGGNASRNLCILYLHTAAFSIYTFAGMCALSSIYFYVLKRFGRKHNDFSWLSSGDFQFWDFSYLFPSIPCSGRVQSQ